MNEPFINYALLEKVEKARLEMPEYQKPWETMENWNVSRVARMCEGFTEGEYAAVVIVALRNFPQVVMKVILDELEGRNP
jgi:hypothetical protein